jgi:hypothetical protein
MKYENVKKLLNEEYGDFESAVSKISCIVRSLRKKYNDQTITLAFKEAMRQTKK